MKTLYKLISLHLLLLSANIIEAQISTFQQLKAGETYYIQSAIASKYLDVQWGISKDGTLI